MSSSFDIEAAINALSAEVAASRADMRRLQGNVDVLMGDARGFNERMARFEERQNRFSEGARGLKIESSDADLRLEAQLSEEIIARKALAEETKLQTQMLTALMRITKNPIVKTVATMMGTALLTWLTSKGLK